MSTAGASLPPTVGPARCQVLALAAALGLCPVAAQLIGDASGAPVTRTESLIDAERALGIRIRPAVQAWALDRPGPLAMASVFYVAHVAVAGRALVWTWYLRRDRFAVVRDAPSARISCRGRATTGDCADEQDIHRRGLVLYAFRLAATRPAPPEVRKWTGRTSIASASRASRSRAAAMTSTR